MRCLVCGKELSEATACPVCGEKVVAVVGNMSPELKEKFIIKAREKKEKELKDVNVFLRSYYWKEENGELVEKERQDIQIGQNFGKLDLEQIVWGNQKYARQTGGEELLLTVVIKDGDGKDREETTKVIAPRTEGFWQIGCVLKPGFKIVIRVGDENNYTDSGEISLKG